MVDRDDIVELAPHYLAMFLLAIATLWALELATDDLNFWIETAIVLVVLVLYRPVVIRLGYAPRLWEQS